MLPMLSHANIWNAIDKLAARNGLSPSGLAKKAGLDSTTFNKSKRTTRDGKLRWPSTESVSKILDATSTTVRDFMVLLDAHAGDKSVAGLIPMISLDNAASIENFEPQGRPTGPTWDQVHFPVITDPHVFALEILGDEWAPIYRDGDIIIISPGASMRRGDRVLLQQWEGGLKIMELLRETVGATEFRTLGPDPHEERVLASELLWMSRIIWASQ